MRLEGGGLIHHDVVRRFIQNGEMRIKRQLPAVLARLQAVGIDLQWSGSTMVKRALQMAEAFLLCVGHCRLPTP